MRPRPDSSTGFLVVRGSLRIAGTRRGRSHHQPPRAGPVIGTTAFVLMCLERIRGQWQRAASLDYLTGLLDVDLFKRINDQHGHEVGDRALKHLAARLQATCRKSDLAGRLGGEEFVLLWDQADSAHCLAAAEHLQDDLLRRADLALYSAKAGGRDRVELAA